MRRIRWLLGMAIVGLAAGAQAADVIGRVLVVVGDVTAVRAGREIRLQTASPIEAGDSVRTGAASNAQIRLTDESIVALRPETEFAFTEYRYAGREDGSERAFFRLLKGGLRTITGIVGRHNNQNYRVETVAATIGIRGTHYVLLQCLQNCFNSDGSLAPDGVYGNATGLSFGTNKVSATNKTGEKVFGINEPFRVPDINTEAQRLIAPPDFLGDKLTGRDRNKDKGKGQVGTQHAAAGGSPDGRSIMPPSPPEPLPAIATEQRDSTGQLAAVTQGAGLPAVPPTGTIPGVGNGAITYRFVSGVTSTVSSIDPNATLSTNSQGQLTAFNATNISGLLGTGTAVADGSNLAAGNLHWGRWIGSGATINTGTGNLPVSELHYIVGDIATLPGAGTFTYSAVGGTPPRTAAGLNGSFDPGGTVTVNFVARNLTLNAWQLAFTGATYTPQGAPTVNFTSSAIPLTNFQWACTGSSCGLTSGIPGQFSGSFVGAGATGIGIVYRAQDAVVSPSVGNGDITGAQGFKKP